MTGPVPARPAVRGRDKPRDLGNIAVVAGGVAVGLALTAGQVVPTRWVLLMTLGLAGAVAVATAGGTRRVLLAVMLLDLALQMDIHLLYRAEAALLGMRGGINVSITLLCLPVLYAMWLWEIRSSPREARPGWAAPTLLLAVYLALSAASGITAGNRMNVIFDLSIMVPAFLVHLYLANHVRDRRDLLFVMSALMAGLLLEAGLMILPSALGQSLDFIPGLSMTVAANNNESLAIQRAQGTFGSPIVAASYLVLLLAPAAGLLVSAAPRRLRVLSTVALMAGGVALILTLSRGAWATGFLSLLLLGIVSLRRGWLRPPLVLGLGAIAILALLPFLDVVVTRLVAPDAGSAYSRIPLMRIALDVIRDHPWIGVGINNLPLVMADYRVMDYGGEWLFQVHNKYLLVWAETGTFGLLAFLGFLGASLWTGWRVVAVRHPLWSPVAMGVVGALLAHALHMLVDSFTARGQVQLLWVHAALLVSMARLAISDGRDTARNRTGGRPPQRY